MAVIELDPGTLELVRDFIRERKRATVEDIRREFFPDDIGTPYLYLDRLVSEGHLLVVPSEESTTWIPGDKPENVMEQARHNKVRNRYRLSREKRFPK